MSDEDDIISKLKFISKIKSGEKINVNGMFIQLEGYVTSISRTLLKPESRQNTLSFVQQIVTKSINLITTYISTSNFEKSLVAKNITNDLIESKQGLLNLKKTYSDDVMFCCNIDSLIEKINIKISEFERTNPELFSDESVEYNTDEN